MYTIIRKFFGLLFIFVAFVLTVIIWSLSFFAQGFYDTAQLLWDN